jgi:hypothetical protein
VGGVCGCLTLRRAVPLDTLVSAGVNGREVAVRGGGEPRQDEERRRRGTARPPLVVSPRQLRKLTLKRAQVAETVRACLLRNKAQQLRWAVTVQASKPNNVNYHKHSVERSQSLSVPSRTSSTSPI